MHNLSRFDRRYAALWLPLAGGLLAGFALLAVLVIGVLVLAGLGLASSALGAWEHFGPRAASVPQLLIGLVFAPLLALVAALLVVGGVMMVLIRLIAFENDRRAGAPHWDAADRQAGGPWTGSADPPEPAGPAPADPPGDEDDHRTADPAGPAHA